MTETILQPCQRSWLPYSPLLSRQWVSTLHKFKSSMMQVLPDRIIFRLSDNLKQSRPANPPEPIIFHPNIPMMVNYAQLRPSINIILHTLL